jgi:MFS family permease
MDDAVTAPYGADGYPRPWRAWTVVLILTATAILSYTDRQVLSLLVDPLRGDLHISDTQVSLLLGTAFALVYGVAGVPLGWLADRISRRNLIAGGVLVWSLGTVSSGLSHGFGQIAVSRVLVGLGEAALSPAAIALISDCFPPQRRGAAVGLFLSGIAVGVGVSILIGGAVMRAVEWGLLAATPLHVLATWRLVLLLTGAPGLIWVFVILMIREPRRRTNFVEGGQTPEILAPSGLPQWRRAAPVYVVLALASLVDNAVGAWAPSLLIRSFAMNAARVGLELGLFLAIGYGGGVLAGGILADRVGLRGGWPAKLGVCLAASLAILPLSLFINASSAAWVFVGVPVYFTLSGVVTSAGFSALLDVTPPQSRALAMSVSFFLNVAIGAGAGPTLVALAADHIFPAKGLGPAITLTVAAGYCLTALAAATPLLRARQNPRDKIPHAHGR